jgi:hypothetical protein
VALDGRFDGFGAVVGLGAEVGGSAAADEVVVEAASVSVTMVWPGRAARSSISAATWRSGALAGASSNPSGMPSGAQST